MEVLFSWILAFGLLRLTNPGGDTLEIKPAPHTAERLELQIHNFIAILFKKKKKKYLSILLQQARPL